MPLERPTDAPHRLDLFSGHVATALRELHVTKHPGALSVVMAQCCLTYLGPVERGFMLAFAAQAASPGDLKLLFRCLDPVPTCSLTAKEIAQHDACARWARAMHAWGLGRGEWRPPPQRESFK